MDPVTLALLGLGGATGIAQGVANAALTGKQAKQNKEQLQETERLVEQGVGLTSPERQLMNTQLLDPVMRAATATRGRAEQVAASGGAQTGADLAALRQEQAQTIGRGAQSAAAQVNAADQARLQQRRNELEQRRALQIALQRDIINSILDPLSQAAGAGGQAAALGQFAPGLFRGENALGGGLPPIDATDPQTQERARLLLEAGMNLPGST